MEGLHRVDPDVAISPGTSASHFATFTSKGVNPVTPVTPVTPVNPVNPVNLNQSESK